MKGPTKNHRPRKYSMSKILLTLTLQRMKDKVGNFLSQFQSAYRNNCWTTDIIQVFRFIDAKAVLYQNFILYQGFHNVIQYQVYFFNNEFENVLRNLSKKLTN